MRETFMKEATFRADVGVKPIEGFHAGLDVSDVKAERLELGFCTVQPPWVS